jgi:hypothetical protein
MSLTNNNNPAFSLFVQQAVAQMHYAKKQIIPFVQACLHKWNNLTFSTLYKNETRKFEFLQGQPGIRLNKDN